MPGVLPPQLHNVLPVQGFILLKETGSLFLQTQLTWRLLEAIKSANVRQERKYPQPQQQEKVTWSKAWHNDDKQSVLQQVDSDRSRGVSEKSSGGFLCGDSGFGLPSPQRPGEEPGAHRWLQFLPWEDCFRELAGKVRGKKTARDWVMALYIDV